MIMQENKTRKYTRKKQRKNGKQIHNLIYTENKPQICISDFSSVLSLPLDPRFQTTFP